MPPFAELHTRCAALGTRLFTVTALDEAAGLARRIYTSHPVEYPVSGTKPLTRDGWHDATIAGRQTFVANTPPEFAKYFFDHELIASLGLGSCINIPVHDGGPVLGTVNLLAEAGHFTPARLAAYHVLVDAARTAICNAIPVAMRN
jgi:GAF domain